MHRLFSDVDIKKQIKYFFRKEDVFYAVFQHFRLILWLYKFKQTLWIDDLVRNPLFED